jgi:uncharacterized repeat protein (TIGR01451 family)
VQTNRLTLIILVAALTSGGLSLSAHAAGTAAGTDINNRATVNYQVGSVAQTPIESSPTGNNIPGTGNGTNTSFETDRSLDLLVTGVDASQSVSVTSGQTAAVMRFTVRNEGNGTQDFSLTATNRSGSSSEWTGTDNFDPSSVSVFVDANGNDSYDAGTDTGTFIDELAADATRSVFIVAAIPLAQLNNDIAALTLRAQVAAGGSSGSQGSDITTDDAAVADNPTTVQNVFRDDAGDNGDALRNGRHADTERFLVQVASLTVTKTSVVISDPVNGATNPKAIPGARVRYTITVTNSGSTAAASIVLTDAIPTNTTYFAGSITVNGVAQTDATDGDDAEVAAGVLTGRVSTIPTSGVGNPSTVVFDVTVN